MKKIIFIGIFYYIFNLYSLAQYENIERIKEFYWSLDKIELISTLIKNHLEIYYESYEIFGNPKDSVITKDELLNLKSDASIIMIVPFLRNSKEYTFKKNIYDFLFIDSTHIQMVYFNKKNGISTILNNKGCITKKLPEEELKEINKFIDINPEIWFWGQNSVFGDYNYKSDNVNYLYLKENRIYVYRSRYKDIYELNEFVRKFYKEKDFKERAIYDEISRVYGIEYYGKTAPATPLTD